MHLPEEAQLLRIFLEKNAKYKNKLFYEAVVEKAKELGLTGATVLRGLMGYGGSKNQIHSSKLLTLSDNLPVVVEIIDSEENIQKILPFIDENLKEGLVTLEKVRVMKYKYKT